MTYKETLDFLYSQLPMYQRQGAVAFKKDLRNTFALCHALGDPQFRFKSIHIAGTNGKGSTAHILDAIYQQNGYKTGLYTSPHLLDFRERIKVSGKMVNKRFVIDFVKRIKPEIERVKPSFFEITVVMAFEYFAKMEVDIAIIETGMGGRLDSTNVIVPELSIITSISRDHTEMLGNSIGDIAREKAGIIKIGVPVIAGLLPDEAEAIVRTTAHDRQCLYYNAPSIPHRFTKEHLVKTDLNGDFQQLNIKTALIAADALQQILPLIDTKSLEALENVKRISNFTGRWTVLQKNNPLVICDVAHNPEGLAVVIQELLKYERPICFILGFVKEKKLEEIIPLFPKEAEYSFVKPEIERGMDADTSTLAFKERGIEGKAFSNIKDAIRDFNNAYRKGKVPRSCILFIGGSTFTVADLLTLKPGKFG